MQTTGEALDLATAGATGTTFLDNIVSLADAVGIVAPATNQVASSATTTCTICRPARTVRPGAAGRSREPLTAFKNEVGSDLDSFDDNPQYVNAARPTNYVLANTSAACNRGDPQLPYFLEPVTATTGNGDRIDIGAQGGTTEANPSPTQLVQLLGQTFGGQRYQVGQSSTINFRSSPV